jgi:hypothetical protein
MISPVIGRKGDFCCYCKAKPDYMCIICSNFLCFKCKNIRHPQCNHMIAVAKLAMRLYPVFALPKKTCVDREF